MNEFKNVAFMNNKKLMWIWISIINMQKSFIIEIYWKFHLYIGGKTSKFELDYV